MYKYMLLLLISATIFVSSYSSRNDTYNDPSLYVNIGTCSSRPEIHHLALISLGGNIVEGWSRCRRCSDDKIGDRLLTFSPGSGFIVKRTYNVDAFERERGLSAKRFQLHSFF